MARLETGESGQDLANRNGHAAFAEHLRHMYNARKRYSKGREEGEGGSEGGG